MTEYKLKDLLKIKNGRDHKNLAEGKYPVYGSGGIMRYVDSFLYDKPSILLPRKGSLSNIQFCEEPFWTVDTIYYTEIDDSLCDPYYLYCYLTLLDLSSFDTGSAVPSMTFDSYYQQKVTLPSLAEQKRVATTIRTIDNKISINKQINRNLEDLAREIYDYWFVQFDFPDKNGNPYKSSGGKMVWNEKLKREIPESWVVDFLFNHVKLFDSQRIPLSSKQREEKKGKIPYYGATGIMDYVDEFLFDDEYILLAEDGSVEKDDGRVIVQMIWGKSWVNNHAHIIQSKQKEHYLFYAEHLSRIKAKKIMSGSIQKKISQDKMKSYQDVLPPDVLISRFCEQVQSYWDQYKNVKEENIQLMELRTFLLPLLMNGQVKVG